MRSPSLLLLHRATGCANVARDESNNVESILAYIAAGHDRLWLGHRFAARLILGDITVRGAG